MILYIIGLIISIIYSYLILPKINGKEPSIKITIPNLMYKSMIIIPYNKRKAIHIHHWIIFLCIILISFFYKNSKIIIGFSFGLLIQGLSYKDRFKIIRNNPY